MGESLRGLYLALIKFALFYNHFQIYDAILQETTIILYVSIAVLKVIVIEYSFAYNILLEITLLPLV